VTLKTGVMMLKIQITGIKYNIFKFILNYNVISQYYYSIFEQINSALLRTVVFLISKSLWIKASPR